MVKARAHSLLGAVRSLMVIDSVADMGRQALFVLSVKPVTVAQSSPSVLQVVSFD